jgi:cation:H+ antiporter
MALDFLWIVLGLVGLVLSADKFVLGASNISLNLGIPSVIVGLVVVGIGTSAPEMLVSANSALAGKPELALGNALGSNIANIAFILGVTALIVPIIVSKALIKKEFLLMIGTTFLGAFLISDGLLSRFDALIMVLALVFIMYFLVSNAMNSPKQEHVEGEVPEEAEMSLMKSIVVTLVGMGFLIGSSKLLVLGAVNIALSFGVSELVIGLTIVAVGTSLPELSASISAALKGKADLAIGNIIGSNIFNILAVLSIASAIEPFNVPEDVLVRDLPILLLLTIGFLLVAFSPKGDGKINRFEGFIFLLIFIGYLFILIGESMQWFNIREFMFSVMEVGKPIVNGVGV